MKTFQQFLAEHDFNSYDMEQAIKDLIRNHASDFRGLINNYVQDGATENNPSFRDQLERILALMEKRPTEGPDHKEKDDHDNTVTPPTADRFGS